MKVWVVNEGEPLPMLTGKGRLMRGGMLAKTFSDVGDEVTWWFSTWLHYEKRYYCNHSQTIQLSKNLTLRLLHVKHAYKQNISIARILYCSALAKKFKKAIRKEKQKPDVIYCSWPLIELSYECVKFGKENKIPVMLDIRDMWPVIFTQPFHGFAKKVVQLFVDILYKRKAEYSFQNANKVISVVPKGFDLAYRYGRPKTEKDEVLYLCFDNTPPTQGELLKANEFLKDYSFLSNKFVILLISTISFRICNIPMVIDVASQLKDQESVQFVICGEGSDLSKSKEMASNLPNVHFLGYRNANELFVLKHISSLALLPYYNTEDFIDSVPNKFGEYLAGGLPIITTLKGLSKTIIEENHCGGFASDSKSLVSLILDYYNDKKLLNDSRYNASSLFLRKFDAHQVYISFCNQCRKKSECMITNYKNYQ